MLVLLTTNNPRLSESRVNQSIMSSKTKGGHSRVSPPQEKQIVQAVLVADSFNHRFHPLTLSKPRVLLPLINRPLLDYSLHFLKVNGVQEVFLFCCSHSLQIKNFVNENWTPKPGTLFTVNVISSETFLSVGDVLRDLDRKALIRSDFILIHGDLISNLPLLDLLEEHKKRKQKDKGCVMSIILRAASPDHKTGSIEDEAIIATESTSGKIVHYEKATDISKHFEVPLNLFNENNSIEIQLNRLDTHISVCSVNVLLSFSENVDYQTRDDFIRGILVDEEILGNTIYTHVTDAGYGARVLSPAAYDSISKDVLRRWAFPVVPDIEAQFIYQRHNVYKRSQVHLTLDSRIEANVAVGEGTIIGSKAFITNSVIGSNCKIGNNVSIEGAYVWDNVEIGDNCSLKTCIVADNACLKSNVRIAPGSIISYGVILGPNIDVKECALIHFDPEDEEEAAVDKSLVGEEGRGFPYKETDESGSESDTFVHEVWGLTVESDDDAKYSSSSGSGSDSEQDEVEEIDDDIKLFYIEIIDNFKRGIEEKVKCENLILEVNSMKHAYNVPINEVNQLIMRAMLDLPKILKDPPENQYLSELMPTLTHLMHLIKNYIKSSESQNDCLLALEEYSLTNGRTVNPKALVKIITFLYENDILEEEAILKWHLKPQTLSCLILTETELTVDSQETLRQEEAVEMLVNWLNEAEEESSDE